MTQATQQLQEDMGVCRGFVSFLYRNKTLFAAIDTYQLLISGWAIDELTMYFKKTFKTSKQMKTIISLLTEDGCHKKYAKHVVGLNEHDRFTGQYFKKKWTFRLLYPGCSFCVLTNLKKWAIPKIYLPERKLPHVKSLKIQINNTVENRDDYVKMCSSCSVLLDNLMT